MARKIKRKDLKNTRLLKEYASWVYCTGCGKTVAYLCYVTYSTFDFTYTCSCGCAGEVHIAFDEVPAAPLHDGEKPLLQIKNRLCCPGDSSPLVTFVERNLAGYDASITCRACGARYTARQG